MLNLALEPEKTYFHYHNAYGHQTWQDGDLPWQISLLHDPLIMWFGRITQQIKTDTSPL